MAQGVGRQLLGTSGRDIHLSADGNPEWLPKGMTIDWTTVGAVGADTPVPANNITVLNGKRYLRYGQVMCRIVTAEVQTITIAGSTSGGTFIINATWTDAYGNTYTGSTPALAWNATAAVVQAAIIALAPAYFQGNVSVGLSGLVYTITFSRILGNVTALTTTPSLTGGANTAVVATSTSGIASAGMFGPYDPAASDGRQTLLNGDCCLLDETILEIPILGVSYGSPNTVNHGGIVGGAIFKARAIMTTGTHSLAAGPTVAEFTAAFPRVQFQVQ